MVTASVLHASYALDLYIAEFRQGCGLHRGPRRAMIAKVFCVDLVHLRKSVHVGEKYRRFYDAIDGSTGGLEYMLKIPEAQFGLI